MERFEVRVICWRGAKIAASFFLCFAVCLYVSWFEPMEFFGNYSSTSIWVSCRGDEIARIERKELARTSGCLSFVFRPGIKRKEFSREYSSIDLSLGQALMPAEEGLRELSRFSAAAPLVRSFNEMPR